MILFLSGRSVRGASLPRGAFCRALLLSLLMLGGCGGGSHTSKKTGTGRVAFIVHWPPVTKSTRLISAASSLIRIQISQGMNGGPPVYGSQDALRPYPPAGASNPLTPPATTVTFNNLPPGQFWATMTAYPNTDGSGVAQARPPRRCPLPPGRPPRQTSRWQPRSRKSAWQPIVLSCHAARRDSH